jgi:hypothetical protein
VNPIAKLCATRGMKRGQVRRRPAADKKSAGGFRKTAEAAEPIDNRQLDCRRGRAAQPGAVKDIEAGGERVGHCTDKISRPGNEGEEPWVIDVEVVWKNFLFQVSQKRVRIGRRFRRRPAQTRHQFVGRALGADRPFAHPREMLDQCVDHAITEPAHFIA